MSTATLPRQTRRSGRPSTSEATGWADGALLLLILLTGAALRLYGLTRYPFEQDELYTEIEARLLFDSPLTPGIDAHPLYYLLQHPWLDLWPTTHLSLRVLPFLFGVLGIWATWALAREVGGRTAGAVAAALVAVSPWHLYASGMARYWSLVYLLAAVYFLFLLRAYRTDRPRHFLMALGALVLGVASHPTFVFAAAGGALGLTLVREDGRFGWRWPSRSAWLYLWGPFLLFLAAASTALTLLSGGVESVRNWGSRGLLGTLRLLPAVVEWATPVLTAAGGLGAVALILDRSAPEGRRFGTVALFGVLFSLALLMAASLVTSVYADYAISMLPLPIVAAGAMIAAGAVRFTGSRPGFALAATLVVLAGVLPSTVSHISDGTRFDYRPALRQIEAQGPDAPVLSVPIILQRHYAPELNGVELEMNADFLDRQLAESGPFWAIIPFRRYGVWQDGSGEVERWVAAHCRLRGSHQRPRLDFRVYRTGLYWCAGA
jgi:hypothetical protein